MRISLSLMFLIVCIAHSVSADNSTRPGTLILERPTLISLGFEWRIHGDSNGNASCAVRYRARGENAWRNYLPLFRIGFGQNIGLAMACGWPRYTIPEALAGSIMDLEPGTQYEVQLELDDPDGVAGNAVTTLVLRTRAEPRVPTNAPVRHVYPPDYEGPREKPAYDNVMHAVNGFRPVCDCYQTVSPLAAEPGTVIKMHAGLHSYDNQRYWDDGPAPSYWLHGTITLVGKGTPAQPIYIVAAGDGDVILDGAGCHNLFNLRSADYLHFEGLTVRNTEIAFHCGFQGLRGGGMKGLTVKNCRIENVVYGILAQDGRSEDFYIADNYIFGCNPSDRLNSFGRSTAGYAVNIAGQGHVVCHNYAANFWDGINVFTSSHSDPRFGQQSRSIDFYNNDIFNCSDQFIETDGGYANMRVLRNRCINCPSQPLSAQPVHAGPVYFIRNIVWNASGGRMAMKSHGGTQAYAFLHNTSSTHMAMPSKHPYPPEQRSWLIMNNLSIGPTNMAMIGAVLAPLSERVHVVDYNAYRAGVNGAKWVVGTNSYHSLQELAAATGYERHGLLVDGYDVFVDAKEPPHTRRGTGLVQPGNVDVRLKPGAAPVDAGAVLAGINDNYSGSAPDIGALEAGLPVPVYGPRERR